MDPLEQAIIAAGFTAIKAIVAQIEEARLADAEKRAAILARLQSSQAQLDAADADAHAELERLEAAAKAPVKP